MRRRFFVASAFALAACGLDIVGIDPAGIASSEDGSASDAAGRADTRASQDGPAPGPVDAGFDAADGNPCNVADACAPLRVFVSSEGSTAKIGGITAADDRCQKLATKAGLGGTWLAWLTTNSDNAPVKRFKTKNLGPYVRIDGKVVADSWDALVKSDLQVPIQIDEKGGDQGSIEVWTGTSRNGAQAVSGCNGFEDEQKTTAPATVGIASLTNSGWSSSYTQECSRDIQRLYCFEQ